MKGKKIIVPVMLASLVGTPAAILSNAVMSNASADGTTNYSVLGPELKLEGYKSHYKVGDAIVVPSIQGLDSVPGYDLNIKVVTPVGEDIEYTSNGQSFEAKYSGIYTIQYSFAGSDTIKTQLFEEISIYVEGDEYSMDMPTNSYHVVPSEMKYTENRVVNFPVPTIYKNDEVLESIDKIELVVTSSSGATFKINTNNSTEDGTYVAKDATTNTTGEAYFTHTFTAAGRYKYKYRYYNGDKVVAVTSTKEFWLNAKSTVEDVELDFTTLSDIPTSGGKVGEVINLPQVEVFEKGNSSNKYDVYTKVKVTYKGDETTDTTVELEEDGFSFIPKYTGDYFVEYEMSIPNMPVTDKDGNVTAKIVKNTRQWLIQDVVDEEKPKVYLTKDYDITDGVATVGTTSLADKDADEAVELIGDFEYAVESYYSLDDDPTDPSVRVAIPAAYVTDNHSALKDITVTRVLYKQGYSSNELSLVKLTGEDETDFNKVAYHTFEGEDSAGTYLVKYTVEDKLGNKGYYTYKIYIVKNGVLGTDWTPQITIDSSENIPSSINADNLEVITFAEPAVVDKHVPAGASKGQLYDKNIQTETYKYYSTSQITSLDDTVFEGLSGASLLRLNDDNKFEIDTNADGITNDIKYLYIITRAKNSYNDIWSYAYKEVKVVYPTQLGDHAPTFQLGNEGDLKDVTISNYHAALIERNKQEDGQLDSTGTYGLNDYGLTTANKAIFDQTKTIILPDVTFGDADENLTVSVYVTYESNGELNRINVSSYDCIYWNNGGVNYTTISNASFSADFAKDYTITFVAKDINNYFTCRSFGVKVNDKQAAVVKVENAAKFYEKLEVGTWFKVPTAYVEDDGERRDDLKATWKVIGEVDGKTGDSFRPSSTGTYYVEYTVVDASGIPSVKRYPIEVVSTNQPIISLVNTDYDDQPLWNDEDKYVYFAVPKAQAKDNLDSYKLGEPEVKDGNSNTIEIVSESVAPSSLTGQYPSSEYYYYKATSQGKYTATYKATGKFGVEAEPVSIVISIGDVVAPTLEWVDKDNDFKAEVTEGDTWQFKMSMINLKDNFDEEIDTDNITITLTDPDGNKVDNGDDYSYTFDKVGDYTFKIVAKDEAGNSTLNTYSYTITSKAKDENVTNKNTVLGMSPALGTTLIVLSVVVLGGVVVYFVLSSNKARKSTNKNKRK